MSTKLETSDSIAECGFTSKGTFRDFRCLSKCGDFIPISEIREDGCEKSMTRRESGFLLVGLGFGLLLSLATILEVFLSLYKSAFISDYSWDKVFLIAPALLLSIGLVLILHGPCGRQE